jgi:antitoxin ParD1/3/4
MTFQTRTTRPTSNYQRNLVPFPNTRPKPRNPLIPVGRPILAAAAFQAAIASPQLPGPNPQTHPPNRRRPFRPRPQPKNSREPPSEQPVSPSFELHALATLHASQTQTPVLRNLQSTPRFPPRLCVETEPGNAAYKLASRKTNKLTIYGMPQQLNVSITPHFSKFIRGKVKSGRYTKASEVVRDALRRFEQEELIQEQTVIAGPDDAAGKILEGWASIQQGRSTETKNDAELKEFFADIVSRGMKRLAAKRRSSRG